MRRLLGLIILLFTLCGCYPPVEYDTGTNELAVHYLDVGQADCSLLISDGEAMLIDGGNADDSRLVYSYLTEYGIKELKYIIATHPHEDHMGGLTAALERADVGKIYLGDGENDASFYDKFIERAEKKNIEMAYAQNGEEISLGNCDVTLYVAEDIDRDNLNNTSVMAKVECGNISFLFTGDAEREAETEVIKMGADLSATVLKAPHHGSDTSSSYQFLREVMPEIIVISAGEDNSYGHPHKEVMSRYRDLGSEIYRTDRDGHIIISTDGEEITVKTSKKSHKTNTIDEDDEEYRYVANKQSKKLHLLTCSNLPKEENRVYFDNRDEAIQLGYTVCKGCNP